MDGRKEETIGEAEGRERGDGRWKRQQNSRKEEKEREKQKRRRMKRCEGRVK